MATIAPLVQSLSAVDKRPLLLSNADNQAVVVLPYGGRVLGLYPSRSGRNFLWQNPALSSAESAAELYASARWHNSGGDRTWLAPELDFFFPALPDVTVYVQPKLLDAGHFQAEANDTEITLRTEFSLRSHRIDAELLLRLSKTVRLLSNPLLLHQERERIRSIEFAGYSLATCLELRDPPHPQAWVSIWNLLQMPGGGELFAPTYHRSEPTIFFGDIPAGHLRTDDRLIRFRMEAPGEQKISIAALATTGRLGYVYNDEGQTSLIVREFAVNPSGAYRDVWFTHPDRAGFAVQACNINTNSLGCFAEMEYHAPAIGGDSGLTRSDDVSYVWAYRGERGKVAHAAKLLLGIDI